MHDAGVAEAPEPEAEIERRSRHHDQVGVPERRGPRPRESELVVGGEQAAPESVGEDRQPGRLGEGTERVFTSRPEHVGADHEDRTLGFPDELRDLRQRVGVGSSAGQLVEPGRIRNLGGRDTPRVQRDVDERRTAVRSARGSEC